MTRRNFWWAMFCLGIAVILFAAAMMYFTRRAYRNAEDLYEEINEVYVTAGSAKETAAPVSVSDEILYTEFEPEQSEDVHEYGHWSEMIRVDLNQLSETYPDVIGWLYFEDGEISYPILYSGDNETYLRRAYTGETTSAGSIFLNADNHTDFSDDVTVLFGHNMRDESMFGNLRNYPYPGDEVDAHAFVQVHTKAGIFRYKIAAGADVADTDVWTPLAAGEQVLNLCTCTASDEKRRVVTAILVDRK